MHIGHLGFFFKATINPALENMVCSLERKECVLVGPDLLGTFWMEGAENEKVD